MPPYRTFLLRSLVAAVPITLAVACGSSGSDGSDSDPTLPVDGGAIDGASPDGERQPQAEAGPGVGDSGGVAVEGGVDAGGDAAVVDAGAVDAGVDAAVVDAGLDAAVVDAGVDAAVVDAGVDAGPKSTDPFDPASCNGAALSPAAAMAKLGGKPRIVLGGVADVMIRSRSCPGGNPANCGAWGAPKPFVQSFLTYSGGAVTTYKSFPLPTQLVLFAMTGQGGAVSPGFAVRHTSDLMHDGAADMRGVVFIPPDPMLRTSPVIRVWDFAPDPNRYDDLSAYLTPDAATLHVEEHCARLNGPFSIYSEIAALYTY